MGTRPYDQDAERVAFIRALGNRTALRYAIDFLEQHAGSVPHPQAHADAIATLEDINASQTVAGFRRG